MFPRRRWRFSAWGNAQQTARAWLCGFSRPRRRWLGCACVFKCVASFIEDLCMFCDRGFRAGAGQAETWNQCLVSCMRVWTAAVERAGLGSLWGVIHIVGWPYHSPGSSTSGHLGLAGTWPLGQYSTAHQLLDIVPIAVRRHPNYHPSELLVLLLFRYTLLISKSKCQLILFVYSSQFKHVFYSVDLPFTSHVINYLTSPCLSFSIWKWVWYNLLHRDTRRGK